MKSGWGLKGLRALLIAAALAVAALATALALHTSALAQVHHLPANPVQLDWLKRCFLPLPKLDSQCEVYQDVSGEGYANEVFSRTNAIRKAQGLSELKRDPHLDAVAQAHATDMAAQGYFDHHSPQGMDVFDRIESVNCPHWWTGGENIAAGYKTPQIAMDAWMNSPGHKRNILDGNYDYIGLGAYYKPGSEYGWYWVQVFASYDESPASNDWIVPGESL